MQVFLLLTFLERRKDIKYRTAAVKLPRYPTVTVIVPCWNEEKTVKRTMDSLLGIHYPKEKLSIFLVDDGSTDTTWSVMQQYKDLPQVSLIKKENGGKHTAMNMGIERATSEFVGCLDADSFVHPEALKRIMTYFFENTETMAVAPSIIVENPKTLIQRIQKVEYNWAVYIKKMLGFNNAIHVTPGPFSIYRTDTFKKIGLFRKAHNTEDMEIAYRMQANHMRIEQANDAYVYTVAPSSVKKLYKQRLRWIYGFIQNTIDYRRILFRKEYGNFSLFTLPSGVVSIIAVPLMLLFALSGIITFVIKQIVRISTVGLSFNSGHSFFDPFFMSANVSSMILILLYGMVIFAVVIGTRMAEGKVTFSWNMVWFFLIYRVIAPLWILKAVYSSIVAKKPSWR